jgi:uncharacterized protein YndB with AHSA1/START domain
MTGTAPRGRVRTSVGSPGRLETDSEGAHVTFRRLLPHPIEEVWAAITEPEQLAVWFLARVSRPSATGLLDMQHISGVHATGRVLEWDPPRVYEYEWNVAPGSGMPQGESSVVRWELTPEKDGTLLVLTHRKLSLATGQIFAGGLQVFLDRLSAHLNGTALPEPFWLADAPKPGGSNRGE